MRVLTTAAAAAFAFALGGAGCAPAASSAGPVPGLYPGGDAPPTVRVSNHNWSNVTVFVTRGTSRFRLGMVTSMSTRTFRIPTGVLGGDGGVQLMVDPIGSSRTFTAPLVHVRAGDQVRLDVQNHLPISSVTVFSRP